MAVQVSYPGVYIEEIPSGAHTVVAATTSSTAFVGYFPQGPMGQAVKIENFEEFTRTFGGLNAKSEASYAIYQFFTNGGSVAWVVRLGDGKQRAASLNPPITVNQPKLDSLSDQAEDAAEKAAQAARRAQGDMTDPGKEPYQVAEEVSAETQTAAEETQKAAEAASAAGQELQLQLSQYEAEYGVEAEETLEAAQEAALAAQDAAAAAAKAAAAAEAADKASDNLAGAPELEAPGDAAEETQKAMGASLAASQENAQAEGSEGKIFDFKDALQSSPPDSDLEAFQAAADQMVSAGLEATTTGNLANQRATEAKTLAGNTPDALTPAFAQQVQVSVQKAQDAANAALKQAQKLDGMVAGLTSPPGDLASDADAILTNAEQAAAYAQVAAAASEWLAQAADESEEMTDAGFSNAATAASNAARSAASAGTTYYGESSPPNENVTDLSDAAAVFQQAAADGPSTDANLEGARTEANNAYEAAYQEIANPAGSPPATLQQAADWAAAAVAAYLAGSIAVDLQTTVEPYDKVENAIQNASAAAAEAAAKAKIAALKAAVADQAAQQDEAAAEGSVLEVTAANPGVWGNALQVTVTSGADYQFTLQVDQMGMRGGKFQAIQSETYRGLTLSDPHGKSYAPAVVNNASKLVEIDYVGPNVHGAFPQPTASPLKLVGGKNGGPPQANNLFPVEESDGPGLEAPLNAIAPNVFNILSIPDTASYSANAMSSALTQAQDYVAEKHAFLIVDIPKSIDTVEKMQSWVGTYSNAAAYYAAVYYPRLMMPDPLQNYRLRNVGPSGTIAGIYARSDVNYGVWTTPAGTTAVIEGAQLASTMTDGDNGTLNELGVNCLRNFAVYGNLVWGGRTLAGADLLDSEWKYVNVRRVADYIEQSLYQSLKWVVFQDNDSRLWSQIRTEVGSFMSSLFTQGAFAGATAAQAYLVKCDSSTTTQTDIDNGIVNILVGFAPEKPAEFVILQLEQLTGQSAS